MILYGLLLVVVGSVHGVIRHKPEFSQVVYNGSSCPDQAPASCASVSEKIEKLKLITPEDWTPLTAASEECIAEVNSDTCTVTIEVGVELSSGNVCRSYLGYLEDGSYFTTNWRVRRFQASGSEGYPDCVSTKGMWGSDTQSLCTSIDGGTRIMTNRVGNVIHVTRHNPSVALVFPGCGKSSEVTVVVELVPDEPTTIPSMSTTAEADEENSSPISSGTDESNEDTNPNDEKPSTDDEKPSTNPEKPGTHTTQICPGSATRSAVLSVLPLAIIGTIY